MIGIAHQIFAFQFNVQVETVHYNETDQCHAIGAVQGLFVYHSNCCFVVGKQCNPFVFDAVAPDFHCDGDGYEFEKCDTGFRLKEFTVPLTTSPFPIKIAAKTQSYFCCGVRVEM